MTNPTVVMPIAKSVVPEQKTGQVSLTPEEAAELSGLAKITIEPGSPLDQQFQKFITAAGTYLQPAQVAHLHEAFIFGARAHHGQLRKSGDPYITHPLAVAEILVQMHMDENCVIAALLHDVIEDTSVSKDTIARCFGDEVAELVDGVSKLTRLDFKSRAEAQAASLQKMLLAMTRDIRVILIKLADRLHNMRTLDARSPAASRRISRETLEIFAPIANRLGITSIQNELEELGFFYHWPWRYRAIKSTIDKLTAKRDDIISTVKEELTAALEKSGIQGSVDGRMKHIYSIYRKMRTKSQSFTQLVDVFAFRIIVKDVDTCYRVLGLAHNLFTPMQGRFKDYIAIPKANGYRSLHTVLVGPQGMNIEIQIRTQEMQHISESGIASHWLYKTEDSASSPLAVATEWLRNVVELQQEAGNSFEFLESVKVDLFPGDVYVFTPKGRIITLKRGSTVVDFAYAIHSDVGNTCVAAKVDRRMSPLSTVLHNGQTVEIITVPEARPHPGWMNFVVTPKARMNIRAQLKKLKNDESAIFGQRLLYAEFSLLGMDIKQVDQKRLESYLSAHNLDSFDDLLKDIGLGNRLAAIVACDLVAKDSPQTSVVPPQAEETTPLVIRGTEGMVVDFSTCCYPIPGDGILAVFNPGSGIVIHRDACRNLPKDGQGNTRTLEVEWDDAPEGFFDCGLIAQVKDQIGALATISGAIAEKGANIKEVTLTPKEGMIHELSFVIRVRDKAHLRAVIERLRSIPIVNHVARASY